MSSVYLSITPDITLHYCDQMFGVRDITAEFTHLIKILHIYTSVEIHFPNSVFLNLNQLVLLDQMLCTLLMHVSFFICHKDPSICLKI